MNNKRSTVIIAGISGNVLEWYDFAVYGYFALTIGKHFFPSNDPTTSVIAAFGAFAAGFLMRPVGSLFFGHLGDKLGRKQALTLSVMLMAIPTFCLGLLPTYDQIGPAAAVLLVLLRMLQGLSVGGEYTTSITFLAEHSRPERRGFFCSWGVWGANAGILLGSGVAALVSTTMSAEAALAWGWRLPFLGGILIGIVGLYIRHGISEPETGTPRSGSPLLESFRYHWRDLLRISVLVIVLAVAFYMIFVYVATWLQEMVHVDKARALDINTLVMASMLIIIPVGAILSDRIGRKPILWVTIGGLALFSYPLFQLMHHQDSNMILLGQLGFALFVGLLAGVLPATMAELAPARVRVTVMSVGYNLTFAVFGGTAPMVSAYLIKSTHVDLSPAIYLSIAAVISLLVVFTLKETAGIKLHGAET
ncbi:MAG: MFS transporter [Candidatus Competibacteraceae bacterium]